MSYFEDLSEYTYHGGMFHRAGTKNVGWLEPGHEFETDHPSISLLDLLWEYCQVSVAQMRGVHECQFCSSKDSYIAERNGQKLLLGTSEIRVFSNSSLIYAAPTLIYHYVAVHRYKPPDEFLRALSDEIRPPSEAYFGKLNAVGLEWNKTFVPGNEMRRFRLGVC